MSTTERGKNDKREPCKTNKSVQLYLFTPKLSILCLLVFSCYVLKINILTNNSTQKHFSPLCHIITLFQTKPKKHPQKQINKHTPNLDVSMKLSCQKDQASQSSNSAQLSSFQAKNLKEPQWKHSLLDASRARSLA